MRTAETVTRFVSVCHRTADTGLNSVCFCWNLHAASRARDPFFRSCGRKQLSGLKRANGYRRRMRTDRGCQLGRGEEGNSSNSELGAACLALEDTKKQQDRKPVILLSDSACFLFLSTCGQSTHYSRCVHPTKSSGRGRGRFTLPLTAPLTQVTGRLASNKSASSGRIAMQYQRGHRCTGKTLCNNPTYRHWRNWCSENTGRRFNRITHYRAKTTRHSGM